MDNPAGKMAELEGRLMAQRRVLVRLMAGLGNEAADDLRSWLAERQVMQDGQEDPGAVPAEGMEAELAMACEFRLLAEALEREARTPL